MSVSSPPGGVSAPASGTKTRTGTVEFSPLDSANRRRRVCPQGLMSSTVSSAAASRAPLQCSSAVIPASESPRSPAGRRLHGESSIKTIYISGEEAISQIQGRARRLGVSEASVQLAAETDLRSILKALKSAAPQVVVIDSVQTLWSDGLEAAPGSGCSGARLFARN